MKQSPNLFQSIIDSTLLLIITDKNGLISFANDSVQKNLGYSSDELIGTVSAISLLHQKDIHVIIHRLSKLAKQGPPEDQEILSFLVSQPLFTQFDCKLRCKEGRYTPFNLSIIPYKHDNNQIDGFILLGTNITERKTRESHLQEVCSAAQATNLAKSQYLAHMSHDLRTPLNSIIGFSNILIKNKFNNLFDEQITYLQRIAENGKHLLNTINEILNLSKIEAYILQPTLDYVDLNDFITTLVNHLEGKAIEKDIKLIKEIPQTVNPLKTDADKLRDILSNLIGNAIKYTQYGQITVRVEVDPTTQDASQIDIIDTGFGIEESKIGKIFEPFYQIDDESASEYGGSGLGLSIVNSLCSLLGYEIKVSSVLNQGSTFSIVLHRENGK